MERRKLYVGFADGWIALAYILCIGIMVLCVFTA